MCVKAAACLPSVARAKTPMVTRNFDQPMAPTIAKLGTRRIKAFGADLPALSRLLGAVLVGRVRFTEAFQTDAGPLDEAPQVLAVDLGEARCHRYVAARRFENASHEIGLEL